MLTRGQKEEGRGCGARAGEPLPATEPPDTSEVDAAWKSLRDHYVMPLPEWNSEEVDLTEWKPNETENQFVSSLFSVTSMPRSFMGVVAGWRRAGAFAARSSDLLPEARTNRFMIAAAMLSLSGTRASGKEPNPRAEELNFRSLKRIGSQEIARVEPC
eukprot:Skav236026  [mRNA]  locus=scaffold1509:10171:11637:+ [translate_table: standard]